MINITLTGEEKLLGALNKLNQIEVIVYEWMKSGSVDEIMNRSFAQNFTSQGIPKWVGLSADTLDDRSKRGYSSGPILVRTGNLRDEVTSMQGEVTTGAKEIQMIWGIDQLRSDEQGKFAGHQLGTDKLPVRPMIGFQDIDGSRLLTSLRDWILTAM
jgi:phage gpG-like protein